jgi:DNA-binding GntR family transcriptional regulator
MQTGAPAEPVFRSKSEMAYDVVRRRILAGDYPPGSVIGQARIAGEMGLSTTPLREALKRLATEGLVVLGTHRDARVTTLSVEEAQNLFEVRAQVDPLACRLAAERRTDDDVARIGAALTVLHPLTGAASEEALAAHRAFHRAIYMAAANPTLTGILDGIWDKSDLYRQRALRTWTPAEDDRERVHRQHSSLRDAIVAGDADRAAELSQAHITHSLGMRAIGILEIDTAHDRP